MAITSRLTGEDVSSRYEAVGSGLTGPVFSEYQGTDRVLNRDVRVCVLNPELPGALLSDSLTSEYSRVSRVAHPAVERVLDILNIKDAPAVVLEPRCGASLQDRVDKVGAFPVAYTLDIAIAAAEALSMAHRSRVFHGNLHLSDINLSPEGIVKVCNLGLASALLTLPPEIRPPDYRTLPAPSVEGDIASFGQLLFGVLAGQSHPTPEGAAAGPATFNGGVPTSLSNLCRRLVYTGCYGAMDEALHDLRAVRDSLRNGRPMPAIAPPSDPVLNGQKGRARTITRKLRPIEETAPVDGALVGGRDLEELSNGSAANTKSEPAIRRSISPAAGIPFVPATAGQGTRRGRRPRSLLSRVVRSLFWFVFLLLLGPAVVIGGFFYITWLKTTPEVTVPDLHGYNVDDARAALSNRGLKLQVDPNGVFDAKVLPGEVLTQMPFPGQHTKAPRSVKVVLSRGTQTVHVPSVVGKPLDEAMSAMQAAGLKPVNRGEMSSSVVPNGDIGRQWPPPDTIVPRDTQGSLRVSAGPSEQDLEARSPSTPQDRTISLDIPPDKPKSGIHWLTSAGHAKTEHNIEIREVSESGDEKTLWHGTATAGDKWEHVVTVEPFNDLRVYLDGHAVHTRLDLPQKDGSDGDIASANP